MKGLHRDVGRKIKTNAVVIGRLQFVHCQYKIPGPSLVVYRRDNKDNDKLSCKPIYVSVH